MPGHLSHSFLRSPPSAAPTTFDPIASIVSAVNLHRDCPPSLLKALADIHPDRQIWMESFLEEKRGIESLDTYTKLTLGEYRALREKGAPHAIPTMCVLTIKTDENLRPLHAKSRIIMRTAFGKRARSLLPCFARIPFAFLPAWWGLLAVLFVRATVKTLFSKAIFRPMK